jgi:hypothetical protein
LAGMSCFSPKLGVFSNHRGRGQDTVRNIHTALEARHCAFFSKM